MSTEKGIVLFESADGEVTLPVRIDPEGEEIWLNRNQLAATLRRLASTSRMRCARSSREARVELSQNLRQFDSRATVRLFGGSNTTAST